MRTFSRRLFPALVAGVALFVTERAEARSRKLPPKAAMVIKANFPKATIRSVGKERERGAWYYEVNLREGKKRFEVEVTEDGVIGEIEAKVALSDVPPELLRVIRKRVGSGRIARVEKHERRGVARSGKFVPLKKPRIMYEVKYYDANGYRKEVQIASNQILELPDKARKLLKSRYPDARIKELEAEDDEGVIVYVVLLDVDGSRVEADVLADGRLLEEETEIDPKVVTLPPAMVNKLSTDRELRRKDKSRFYKRETWGAVEDAKVVGRRDITYVARVVRGEKMREYRFDGRGKLINKPSWEAFGDDEDDDDDDDDDDDHHDDDDDDDDDDD